MIKVIVKNLKLIKHTLNLLFTGCTKNILNEDIADNMVGTGFNSLTSEYMSEEPKKK